MFDELLVSKGVRDFTGWWGGGGGIHDFPSKLFSLTLPKVS